MAKKLSQLMPDLKKALIDGRALAAETITNGLKTAGPYWSGDVERSWRITADAPVENNVPARDISEVPKPAARPSQPSPIIGGVPQGLELKRPMYIGSKSKIIDYAADLRPWGDSYRYEKSGSSAQRDWFTIYTLGGEMQSDLSKSMEKKKREAGF